MDNNDGLFAVFIEARQNGKRTQWMLFPPAKGALGAVVTENMTRAIKRRMEYTDHRAKWKTLETAEPAAMERQINSQIDQYESLGWVFMAPIVIRLDHDDYAKAYSSYAKVDTPYKALRHVGKVAGKRGYTI